jgi:hypothetical protein
MAADRASGLQIFSAIEYNGLEGESNGLQIIFVPYRAGVMILWRTASGGFDKPLLLSASHSGNSFKVVVPEPDDLAGEWTLTLKSGVVNASGPRELHYELRQVVTR